MARGPLTITPVSCGEFTAAEQQQFGTTATGGLIYRFANDSNSLIAAPKLTVNFLDGTTVVGGNVSADPTPVAPGQSGTGEVDAVGDSGRSLTFDGCQIMLYYVVTSAGVDGTAYAG